MKNRNLISDENGAALTVFLLLLIPFLILMMISRTEINNILSETDTTLQNAVSVSTKQAAMMVDIESQSKGDPRISYEKSIAEFKKQLKYSLALDDNFSGLDYSSVNEVKYWVLIYNGDTLFSGYNNENKVSSYAYYNNQNGIEEEYITNTITGFPKDLWIADDGIKDSEVSNSVKVTLKAPCVLAVVRGEIKPIMTNNAQNVTRWALAKIVKK